MSRAADSDIRLAPSGERKGARSASRAGTENDSPAHS